MTTRHASIVVKLPDDDIVALNRAANALKKTAATAPRSFITAVRVGMRLQRALDRVGGRRHA